LKIKIRKLANNIILFIIKANLEVKMSFNDLILRTINGEKTERTPIWLMRQAGRYMPEYREVRSKVTFLELCKTPELACKVTLDPVNILGLDAAILFSDIMVPVEAMGIDLDFNPGPVISNPIRTLDDADKLRVINPNEDVPYVIEAVKLLVSKLNVPLIGFSGAPFTLACYMVEGGGSKNFLEIKNLMHNNTKAYSILMEKISDSTIKYLQSQIDNGCPIVQIFDTWAGIVSPYDYEEFILPYIKYVIDNLKGANVIYFAKDSSNFYDKIKTLDCSGIGVDWKIQIQKAAELLDNKFILQGNLDPALLFCDTDTLAKATKRILEEAKNIKGHIFNLGHGIMPKTPVENVKFLINFVKEHSISA
jgi:uroporphyrinogen decarboxylase